MPTPLLVSTDWLASNLADPNIRILDATTYMSPQPIGASICTTGKPDYLNAHIPGAQHVSMTEDLADPSASIAYTLPSESQIATLLCKLGISNSNHVVIYTSRHPMVATRAWWVLTTLGHQHVSILDGGFEKWVAEGRQVTSTVPTFPAANFTPTLRKERVKTSDEVLLAIDSPDSTTILNALMPDQHKGIAGPHYGRPGRIPNSVNVPFITLLDLSNNTFKSREEMKEIFAEAGVVVGNKDEEKTVINYCGGAIAATATAFALELLGHSKVAVYDGSLLEWSTDQSKPMVSDGPHEGMK